MYPDLRGRTALVTGSSDGIGAEIALRLSIEEVEVIVHGKNPEKVERICSKIREASSNKSRVHQFVADATKPEQISRFFETKMPQIGKLDILVNNIGGIPGIKTFEKVSDEEWYDTFTLNVMAPVRFTRLALPYLKRSAQARIINLGSAASMQPGVNNPHYLAAKTGLVNLNKYLSNDLPKYNILVNMVCPHTIKGGAWFRDIRNITNNTGVSLEQAAQQLENSVKIKVPLNRVGTMEEVANLVIFLASNSASFINGECIFVDGGTKRSIF